MSAINFKIEKKIPNSLGRAGVLETPHGVINTPAFVAVGTKATVKSLTPEQIREAGCQVVLANTYHLYLEPGEKIIKEAGGLGKFMNWLGPTFTDSGGFQAFSLGVAYGEGIGKFIGAEAPKEIIGDIHKTEKKAKVTEEGVEFVSVLDGTPHFMSPEDSIRIQEDIGADMIFALDEFTSPHATHPQIKATIERTERWAKRCLEEHRKLNSTHPLTPSQRDGEDHFDYHTTDALTWRALQEQAVEMRKNPTESEEILWRSLRRRNSIGSHFRRQHIIGNFIVDFVCLEKSLVIEVDGDIHDYQKERDAERTELLKQKGFKVIRFRNEEILNDLNSVIGKITLHLKALPLGKGLGWVDSFGSSLFGIVQGGRHEDLRKESAKNISKLDFNGFGIGGTFIKEDMATAVRWVNEILPEEKPRHLLGVGEPIDLLLGVENGVDTFDCVAATRMARNGALYTSRGKINITNAKYKNDFTPILNNPFTGRAGYTYAYIHHLFVAHEMLAATLATIHNLSFLNNFMTRMRIAILEGQFEQFKEEFLRNYR